MSWLQTYTGKAVSLPKPHPDEIDIIDIAHSLAFQCRYNGHSKRFFSVSQHSCHIHDLVPDELKLAGLMHDASEAYLCDIPRPLKPFLQGYKEIENDIMGIIAEKYGVTQDALQAVKEYDDRILLNERDQLCSKPPKPWMIEHLEPLDLEIPYWTAPMAEGQFLKRFFKLKPEFKPKETFNRELVK